VAPASVANGNFQRQPGFYLAMVLAFTALMVVGAVIVAHRPGNAIGWIFSAVGLLSSAGALGMEYAEYAYVTRPGSLPGAVVAASIAHWYWNPLLGLILVFTPLLFPTGRLLSARWRPVALVAAVGMAAMTVLVALQPTIRLQNEDYTVRNPIGLAGVPDPEEGVLGAVLLGLLFGCMAAAVASVGVAVPPLPGVERQQLKWFSYAAALMAVSFLLWGFLLPAGGVTDVVFGLTIALVPVAAGIAILRYRLYDIDRIINRTLVYGLLTALLGAVYAGAVLLLGQLFGGMGTEPPSWAVAGATLAVAALFQPARRRIQAIVDRRSRPRWPDPGGRAVSGRGGLALG